VREQHERVVLRLHAVHPPIELGVDRPDGAAEVDRLIDEVRADVVQHPLAVGARVGPAPAGLGRSTPPLEPRLEAPHVA
jgi:hypothetical protein